MESPNLLRHRVRALVRALPGARLGAVEGVHQARVATRRLRAALPVVSRASTARKLDRRVRRLTRALGGVRELDVLGLLLAEPDLVCDVPPDALETLRRAIAWERHRLIESLIRAIDRCDVDEVRRKAMAHPRAGQPAGRRGARDAAAGERASAARRAARRAERLRQTIDTAAGIYLPDRLHEVRLAVKKLRYALEIVREIEAGAGRDAPALRRMPARDVAGWLRVLKRAQDLLGRMHDFEVLITRTRAVQSAPASADLRTSAGLDRLVRRLEAECRQLHGRYIALRRALLAICDTVSAASRPPRRVPAA